MPAIALSGGGSKGDFQVGVLHYLFDNGVVPNVITSTSVGSVNALKLCEGEGSPEQGLAGLTRTWLSLDTYSQFFKEQPWLLDDLELIQFVRRYVTDFAALNSPMAERAFAINDQLQQLILAEQEAIVARQKAIGPLDEVLQLTDQGIATFVANLMPGPGGIVSAISLGIHVADMIGKIKSLIETVPKQTSFFNLNPTRRLASENLNLALVKDWSSRGNKLFMAAVALRSGELHYITEDGILNLPSTSGH